MAARELFGGAITACIPEGWLDASDARPIPDHQEVWMDPTRDRTIIVELLEQASVPLEQCGEFHFEELASGNEATSMAVFSSTQLPPETLGSPSLRSAAHGRVVHGAMAVPRQQAELQLRLVVLRLPAQETDLLVSVMRPAPLVGASSAAQPTGDPPHDPQSLVDAELLASLMGSLEVRDWGLFGG
jgi:hypothetical protein